MLATQILSERVADRVWVVGEDLLFDLMGGAPPDTPRGLADARAAWFAVAVDGDVMWSGGHNR